MIPIIRLNMITPLDIDKIIGINLKRIRIERGMGQEEFAQKISISKQRLSAYENAKEGLGKDVMSRICTVYNIDPYEFYIEDDTPLPATELERKALYTIREAEKMGAGYIAEEACNFTKHRLDIIKKHPPSSPDESETVRDMAG